jgi:hypothetical protein
VLQVTLGNETRLVQLTASAGYGDLLAQVAGKFPNSGACRQQRLQVD